MANHILQSLSLWLQGTWLELSPKRRHQTEVDKDFNPKRLTHRQTYFLAALSGRKPDLMTNMHLMDNRLQGMRKNDRQGRSKWCPNANTQDYHTSQDG